VGGNEALINVASNLRRRELELARRQSVDELENTVVSRTGALREALAELERGRVSAMHAERNAVDRLVAALSIRSEETGGTSGELGASPAPR
jgi:hypothetical protein